LGSKSDCTKSGKRDRHLLNRPSVHPQKTSNKGRRRGKKKEGGGFPMNGKKGAPEKKVQGEEVKGKAALEKSPHI